MPDFLFSEFSSQNINANTALVLTSGRTAKGIAPGTYVADAAADAALFAAHPRFVARSANGRYFRALPIAGALEVELGGASGDGVTNDQPALQAAIAYAEACGIRRLRFVARQYRLHCPVRSGDPDGLIAAHLYDGRPLVISTPMVFESLCKGGSRLVFRHTNGAERKDTWQSVFSPSTGQTMVWRGGGIFVKCPATEPSNYADRPGITLIDMTLDGGIPRGQVYEWPARTSDGEGWDVSDKGIEIEADRYSGDICLIRSRIVGFRGELIFQAGLGNGELIMRTAELGHTNGCLFQSCGTNLDIDGFYGHHAYSTFEGWSGRRGQMRAASFEHCVTTGGIAGGMLSSGTNRNAPTRFADGDIPWFDIDARFDDCGNVFLGSWTRGKVDLTDSCLILDGANVYAEGLHDVDLAVTSTVDRIGDRPAVVLSGSMTAGRMTLANVRLRLHCSQTEQARAAGRRHLQPVDYIGSIGANVIIENSSGVSSRRNGPSGNAMTSVPDNFPCFRANAWQQTTASLVGVLQDLSADPQLIPRGDEMALTAPTGGLFPFSLRTAGVQHGHELTIRNAATSPVYGVLPASSAGCRLGATRVLAPGQRMALRFDGTTQLWTETLAPPPLRGTQSPAFAEIAAGGLSPEVQIAVAGAQPGMTGKVASSGDHGPDFEVCAVRCTASAVSFRLRNLAAAPLTPPTLSWTAEASYMA